MMWNNSSSTALVSAGILGAISLYWWWSRKGNEKIPRKWRQIGTLEYLAIYPLKSGSAVSIKKGYCSKYCLQAPLKEGEDSVNDRSLVIFDENSRRFTTGRNHPKLVLIRVVSYDNVQGIWTLEAPDMPPLQIELPKKGKPITCQFFGEDIQTIDCGDKAAKWIRDYLKSDTQRFGYYITNIVARRKPVGPWEKFTRTYKSMKSADFGLFSDMSPYMMLNKNSITDLNQRLERPVTHRFFRGNFLIEGPGPYEEDNWQWVRIGSKAIFKSYKPCTRCLMTTIDPDQGVKSEQMQPLKTLKSYRQLSDPALRKLEGEAPVMGNYFGLCVEGEVNVGDIVYIPDE